MPYVMTEENPALYIGKLLKVMHDHGLEVYGPDVNVNIVQITNLINAGTTKVFVMRHDNDEIVGYSFWSLSLDLMFADRTRADEVCVYVYPKHRGRPAVRFLRFTEMKLRDIGIRRIVRYSKLGSSLSSVFRKMDYCTEEELMHIKDI